MNAAAEEHTCLVAYPGQTSSAPLLDRASPLRTARLRDPVGPQIQFASEFLIDEIAAAIAPSR